MVGATQVMGLGWGGVGMITFFELANMVDATQHHVPCTCTHGRCYASHGMGWGGDDNVPCTCTHGRCYASHVIGVGWGGDDNVPWTCTHGRCYASHGMGWGWGGVGMITFLALAHMVGAIVFSSGLNHWQVMLQDQSPSPNALHRFSRSFAKVRTSWPLMAPLRCKLLQMLRGVPSLKGVSHIRHLFSPLSTIPKKGLVQDELKLLRHLSQQGCCKETRSGFLMVGGDNVAESIASITKSQLRHFGLSKVSRDGIEHRNVLAVHHINQRPGLATVLDALKKHRSLASRSFLSPSQVFKQPLWQV